MSLRGMVTRQGDDELGAVARGVARGDRPMVGKDDAVADREAETRALPFRLVVKNRDLFRPDVG